MEDLELALRSALPIDNIDRVLFDQDDGIVLVWVDMQERPDVATLAARHGEEEGSCTCTCTLFSGNQNKRNMILGLRIEMRTPTRTAFHLAFKVERYIKQLSLFAQFGKLWIVPGPPPAYLTGTQEMDLQTFIEKVMNFAGQGIMIELEPTLVADVQALLDEWKQTQKER
ncbi:MAG TPA: hypothetical protein VGL94_19755 [Ktedonobacteraceae bacterium]